MKGMNAASHGRPERKEKYSMKKRMFGRLLALAVLVLLTACGAAPAASPEPGPFDASPCVELSVKFFSHTAEQYRLSLQAEKGKWTLRTVDYTGAILEPGTDVLAAGEGREDLPFDRFLTVLRAYGAESWDGWKTAGGEETFSLELVFEDGSRYSASGGEAPAGFAAFKEAFVREMARFGEDFCGLEPQTLQERLLNANPMFGDEGYPLHSGPGITYDIYRAYTASVPLGGRLAKYHSPTYTAGEKGLAGFLGEKLTETEEYEWYRVNGLRGKKYLISRDAEGTLRLWIFRIFLTAEDLRAECTAEELLREVYGVSGPEDIQKVIVSPGIHDNAYPYTLEPEQRLQTWVLEDREALDALYGYLTEIGPLGNERSEEAGESMRQRRGFMTYSFSQEGISSPMYWGERKLQIVLADGATVDQLIYDANCGFLYDYTQAGYCGMLSEEAVRFLNALFGIE